MLNILIMFSILFFNERFTLLLHFGYNLIHIFKLQP